MSDSDDEMLNIDAEVQVANTPVIAQGLGNSSGQSSVAAGKRKSSEEHGNSHDVSNADLFSLFTSYLNNKLSTIEKNFSDTTESLVKRVKKSENTFKFKGNQVQFELNSDIQDNIQTAVNYIEKNRSKKAVNILQDSAVLLKRRNKLIRIADKSEGGWRTVNEYLSDEVASDSEDEKKIRAADNRAVKKLKAVKGDKRQVRKLPAEAAGSSSQVARNGGASDSSFRMQPFRAGLVGSGQGQQNRAKSSDLCFNCGIAGHWARDCKKGQHNRSGTSRGAAN